MFCISSVPGAPPRKLEVEAINSTAIRVTWKPPLSGKQHGQIRGYQVIYSRLENGEPRGHPNIMDVALPEAQVTTTTTLAWLSFYYSLVIPPTGGADSYQRIFSSFFLVVLFFSDSEHRWPFPKPFFYPQALMHTYALPCYCF